MDESPRVDVIILSWNRPDATLAAIESARNQSGVHHRILIVDQGSDPENLARLEAFVATIPSVELKKLSENVGVPEGRNIATAMGVAPYIVALDSDAVFADAGVLARAAQHLDEEPHLCAIAFAITNYFTGETDWTSWDYPKGNAPDREFDTTRFVGAGHAIRRSTFEAVGGYDASLRFCGEESDVCYRMINTGKRIVYRPSLAVRHKVAVEHRVFWDRGRYFQTARNVIYSLHKFGTSKPRLLLAAGAVSLRGVRNGVGLAAVRGVLAAIPMCFAFARSTADKSAYRLTPETWQYIRKCEPARNERWYVKLRRQLVRLPAHGGDSRR